jgi:hypothetical protein
MKGPIRRAALVALVWLAVVWIPSHAAADEARDTEVAQPLSEQRSCYDVLVKLDEAVELAEVRDIQAPRISGFPYYRVNRFLASFARELSDDEARKEWLTRILRLGDEGRRVEVTNLPKGFFPDLPEEFAEKDLVVEMERCAARLMAEDLRNPQRMKSLKDHASVPDEYNTLIRSVGLNPVSRWFVMREILDLQNQARHDFQRPEAMSVGKIQWYVPCSPRPAVSHEKRAALLEQARNKSALGIPEPDTEELAQLFDYYAPVWRISINDDNDRIGRPFWHNDRHIEVDTGDAVVYRYHSFTRIGDQVLLQLNYMVWFPSRPSQSVFDIYSGHLDGLIWRVTLDHQGRVLLYDSVHPCGCYHKYYPVSPHLHPLKAPSTQEPPLIFTKNIPNSEKGRVVIHLSSREHYVVGLSTLPEQIEEGVPYRFDDYTTLRNLPYRKGHRSMFNPDGVVTGTERAERWLVWPTTGVPYAGAMRQRGYYPVTILGRLHFDDARFFESVFRFQE